MLRQLFHLCVPFQTTNVEMLLVVPFSVLYSTWQQLRKNWNKHLIIRHVLKRVDAKRLPCHDAPVASIVLSILDNNLMGSGMGPEKHFSAYFLVTFQLSLFTLYWSTEAFSFTSSLLVFHSSFSRVQQSWHQLDSFSSFSAGKTTENKQSSWTLRNLIVALYNSTITGEGIFWGQPASVFKGSTTARKAFRQNSKLEFLIHYLVTSQQILSLKSGSVRYSCNHQSSINFVGKYLLRRRKMLRFWSPALVPLRFQSFTVRLVTRAKCLIKVTEWYQILCFVYLWDLKVIISVNHILHGIRI